MALTRITKGVIKPNENYDTHNINSTGIVTAIGLDVNGNADVSGSLSVGGVLTYEDVTSIDSVGIITARDGIHVGAGVSAVGVITASSFYGDGSNLTGIDATALKDPAGNVKIQAQASGAVHTGIATFQDLDVDGHTNLDNVSIAGVTTTTDDIIIGADNKKLKLGVGEELQLYQTGNHSIIQHHGSHYLSLRSNAFNVMDAAGTQSIFSGFLNSHSSMYFNGAYKIRTQNTGAEIVGTVVATGADINGDLDVDGHTNLDNVSIAGVTTFASDVGIAQSIFHYNDTDTTIGFPAANQIKIHTGGVERFLITNSYNWSKNTTYVNTTNESNDNAIFLVRNNTQSYHTIWESQNTNARSTIFQWNDYGNSGTAGNLIFRSRNSPYEEHARFTGAGNFNLLKDLDVDGHTNLDNLSVAGVSTFTGNADFSAGVDVTGNVNATGHLDLTDSGRLLLGTGDDLQIYHTGSASKIDIWTTGLEIATDGTETSAKFNRHGSVELWHDGSKKLHTTSGGIQVEGSGIFNGPGGNTTTLQLKNATDTDGTKLGHSSNSNAGFLQVTESNAGFNLQVGGPHTANLRFQCLENSGDTQLVFGTEKALVAKLNGAVELYNDNSRRLRTYASGVKISTDSSHGRLVFEDTDGNFCWQLAGYDAAAYGTGGGGVFQDATGAVVLDMRGSGTNIHSHNNIKLSAGGSADNLSLYLGASDDMRIYHSGSHSYVKNTTNYPLWIQNIDNQTVNISNTGGGNKSAVFNIGGAAELYHANTKRFETTSQGIEVTSNSTVVASVVKSTGSARADMRILAEGSGEAYLWFDASNGDLSGADYAFIQHKNSSLDLIMANYANDVIIKTRNGSLGLGGLNTSIHCHENGAVDLYHDSTKRLETTSSGVTVTGTVDSASDVILKENIKTIDNALDKVTKLRGVEYDYKENKKHSIGVIAQEVEEVLPELVNGSEQKSVAYGNIAAVLIEAIKEQNEIINKMKREIEDLKG